MSEKKPIQTSLLATHLKPCATCLYLTDTFYFVTVGHVRTPHCNSAFRPAVVVYFVLCWCQPCAGRVWSSDKPSLLFAVYADLCLCASSGLLGPGTHVVAA